MCVYINRSITRGKSRQASLSHTHTHIMYTRICVYINRSITRGKSSKATSNTQHYRGGGGRCRTWSHWYGSCVHTCAYIRVYVWEYTMLPLGKLTALNLISLVWGICRYVCIHTCVYVCMHIMLPGRLALLNLISLVQGGDDAWNALSSWSLFAKEPPIIGLFYSKQPMKIRHLMRLRRPVWAVCTYIHYRCVCVCENTQCCDGGGWHLYVWNCWNTHKQAHTSEERAMWISDITSYHLLLCVCDMTPQMWHDSCKYEWYDITSYHRQASRLTRAYMHTLSCTEWIRN